MKKLVTGNIHENHTAIHKTLGLNFPCEEK